MDSSGGGDGVCGLFLSNNYPLIFGGSRNCDRSAIAAKKNGTIIPVVYNSFPTRELTASTTAMYRKAITFVQILALIFPILRKTKDKMTATIATTK
jgi:hypothetical protein